MKRNNSIIKITGLIYMSFVFMYITACKTQVSESRYYKNEVQCLGLDANGNQLLRSWSYSKNLFEEDQLEVAKQRAIKEVIFKGIRNGNSDCSTKPLIFEMNAETKYEEYFNKFFSKDGPYKNYSELINPELYKGIEANVRTKQYDKGIDVKVNIRELKKKLIEDNIIPKN